MASAQNVSGRVAGAHAPASRGGLHLRPKKIYISELDVAAGGRALRYPPQSCSAQDKIRTHTSNTPPTTDHTTPIPHGRSAASCSLRSQHGNGAAHDSLSHKGAMHMHIGLHLLWLYIKGTGRTRRMRRTRRRRRTPSPAPSSSVHVVLHYLYLMVTSLAGALDCHGRYSRCSRYSRSLPRSSCAAHATLRIVRMVSTVSK